MVVLVGAPATLAGPTGAAATVGATQSQIAEVQAQIVASGERIHGLTSAYDRAEVTTSSLAQQLGADRAALAAATAAVDAGRRRLASAALDAYTGGGDGGVAPSDPYDPGVGSAYLTLAAGDVSDTVDSYALKERHLGVAAAAVASDRAAAAMAEAQAGAARNAAVAQAGASEARLESLETQLSTLQAEAQQAAAQQAAAQQAAANQAAANQAAAQHAAAQAQAARARPAAPPPAAGGPVQQGLVSAVTQLVTPTAPAPSPSGGGASGGQWLELRQCESGDDYQADTGNGFYGAYQFSASTWTDLGYPGRPDQEPPAMQDEAAMRLQAQSGWGQWPACAAALGLS